MEKKDEAKKMNSGMTWAQVAKLGHKKTTPTSSSSFTKAAAGSFSWAAGGGAWTSSNQRSSRPVSHAWSSQTSHKSLPQKSGLGASSSNSVAPAWPSRTPYKSVPQRSESGASFGNKERTSKYGPVWKVKPHTYRCVEASPVPPVRQVTAFPSVWSPSTARKVTKKIKKYILFFFFTK